MPGVTLVAHYGPKPPRFECFLRAVQKQVISGLGRKYAGCFRPYGLDQIHLTMIGLEGARTDQGVVNDNTLSFRSISCLMNFPDLLQFLYVTNYMPMNARFAGFQQDQDHGFMSAGKQPFERSFFLAGDRVVMIGWPFAAGRLMPNLAHLRESTSYYGALHKYARQPGQRDNDFFMVIGRMVLDGLSDSEAAEIGIRTQTTQDNIRRFLAESDPIEVPITWYDLSVIRYSTDELRWGESNQIPLDTNPTVAQLEALY